MLRAGYSLGYNRPGMSDFTGAIDDNPGIDITANRSQTLGNLGAPGSVLLRHRNQLGPPDIPVTRVFPFTAAIDEDVHIFDPSLQVPYAQTWSAGWQRRITGDMAVELRYVGTRFLQGWTEYDVNEVDIIENGVLDEFRLAQRNLRANIAAGRGATFGYAGPGTATSPLPIFLAYFTGLPRSQSGDASAYTSELFSDATFVDPLATYNPRPQIATDALDGDQARRDNALHAGLPANFLVANPHLLGGAEITGNGEFTRYDGLQVELRKRLSHGLQVEGSYTFGKAYVSDRYSFRTPRATVLDSGAEAGVTHAFKANWVYELPFGRDRAFFGGASSWLDRLIGGWSFDGIARIQGGRLLDFGNVRLVGMTAGEFAEAFDLRFDDDGKAVYMLPQEIIDNTVRAFDVSATSPTGYGDQGPPSGRYLAPANGPDCIEVAAPIDLDDADAPLGFGECGARSLIVTGPRQVRFDLSVVKKVAITGRVSFEFRAELLNAFNHPWFTPVTGVDTGSYDDPDNFRLTDVGETSSRIIQLVSRLSW
ncbi:MAG: hypothetical protein ACRD2X_21505 [Vicinamibacteraceae bacterium]